MAVDDPAPTVARVPSAPSRPPPPAFVRSALWLRTALDRLRRRLAPPSATVVGTALAVADTQALRVLAILSIPDHLSKGPRSSAQLAASCGADPDALHRVLRYLVSRGLLGVRRGRFCNNRVSRLLRVDHPGSMRDLALFAGSGAHFDIWKHLDDAARGGTSAASAAFGRPFFDVVTTEPDLGRAFDGAMQSLARLQSGFVTRRHDFSDATHVCDVGGGTGALLAEVLAANPSLRGTLFDLPHVVAKAAPVLATYGIADRVELAGGSFFDRVPAGADRYLLQSIIHDWDDESCVRILANTRAVMAPNGRILVIEHVLPTHHREHPAHSLDLEMLVLTGSGRERTMAEYNTLFEQAGLQRQPTVGTGIVTMFELARRA